MYIKIKTYEGLLQKRNILAHVTQTKTESAYIFKARGNGVSDYVLTDEECLSLRKNILELCKLLDGIN